MQTFCFPLRSPPLPLSRELRLALEDWREKLPTSRPVVVEEEEEGEEEAAGTTAAPAATIGRDTLPPPRLPLPPPGVRLVVVAPLLIDVQTH